MDYESLKEHLERQVNQARAVHEREQRAETSHALRMARERYERFVLHGMIPEDLAEGPEIE